MDTPVIFLFWIIVITLLIIGFINLLLLLDLIFGSFIFNVTYSIKNYYIDVTTRKERESKQKEFEGIVIKQIEENEKWN